MRKLFFYGMTFLLLGVGCTSKEQDQQIQSFWQEQIAALLPQRAGMRPQQNPGNHFGEQRSGFPPSEEINPEVPAEIAAQPEQLPPAQISAESQPGAEVPAEGPAVQPVQTVQPIPTQQPAVPVQKPRLTAILFIHSQSPVCQQLKADGWDKQFEQKYQGKVRLVQYDMINPSSKEPLRQLMRQHKLPSLSVPILFIGNAVIPGYPFQGVDAAVQKALTQPKPRVTRKTTTAKKPAQFMEIIMEDDPKNQPRNVRASARDSRAMQLALASVERNNQSLLTDVASLFGEDTKAQAFAVVARTERLLRRKASSSPDYKTYLATQKQLLKLQEKEINQLMRQNTKNIRTIRG